MIEILKRVPLNPKFLVMTLNRNRRGALQYQTSHAKLWRRKRS